MTTLSEPMAEVRPASETGTHHLGKINKSCAVCEANVPLVKPDWSYPKIVLAFSVCDLMFKPYCISNGR